MGLKLTDKQLETVVGYADGADRVMQELGIDRETLEAALLDENVERCKNIRCGWYDDSGSMLGEDGEPDGFCENCRRYV